MRVTLSALSLLLAGGIALSGIAAQAQTTYHAAPEKTYKTSDGMTVHRHADGSVEVSEPEERTPLYPSQSSAPARHVAHKKAVAHKAATTVKKSTTTTTTSKPKHK